jgi:hypothetical protein
MRVICAGILTCLMGLLIVGCNLPKKDSSPPPNIDAIQSRVAIVANIALGLDAVKPFREQLCKSIDVVVEKLGALQDKDLTREQISEIIRSALDQHLQGQVAEVAKVTLQFIVDQTFDYAWERYNKVIESYHATIVLALVGGLDKACDLVMPMSVSSVDTKELEAKLAKILKQ